MAPGFIAAVTPYGSSMQYKPPRLLFVTASPPGNTERDQMFTRKGRRRCRWSVLAVLLQLMPALPFTTDGRAEGALAVGLPKDVARDGVAMGWVINARTKQRAEQQALAQCRDFQDAAQPTRDLCKIVESFRGECLAIAMDPQNGTSGIGWATGATQPVAEGEAMAKCSTTAGKRRQRFCQVSVTRCEASR